MMIQKLWICLLKNIEETFLFEKYQPVVKKYSQEIIFANDSQLLFSVL